MPLPKVNRNLTQQLALSILATVQLRVNWWWTLTCRARDKGAKLFQRGWYPALVGEMWWWAWEVLQRTSEMKKPAQRQKYFQFLKEDIISVTHAHPQNYSRGVHQNLVCVCAPKGEQCAPGSQRGGQRNCHVRECAFSPTSWQGKQQGSTRSLQRAFFSF